MNMKKVLWTVIPLVLIAGFLVGGLVMRTKSINKEAHYQQVIAEARTAESAAQAAYDGVDTSAVDALNEELSATQQENVDTEDAIRALTEETAAMDENIAANQKQFDAWAADEENAYYLAVFESLSEGKAKVEEYINNP